MIVSTFVSECDSLLLLILVKQFQRIIESVYMFDMKIMVSKKIVSSVLYLVICVAITFLFFFLEKTENRKQKQKTERPEPEPLLEVEQQMEYKVYIENEEMLKFMHNILKCRTS